jgi:hypothetical protein
VVSVDFMPLSSKKAAYVVVDGNSVVGNPEFAPNDKERGVECCGIPLKPKPGLNGAPSIGCGFRTKP